MSAHGGKARGEDNKGKRDSDRENPAADSRTVRRQPRVMHESAEVAVCIDEYPAGLRKCDTREDDSCLLLCADVDQPVLRMTGEQYSLRTPSKPHLPPFHKPCARPPAKPIEIDLICAAIGLFRKQMFLTHCHRSFVSVCPPL